MRQNRTMLAATLCAPHRFDLVKTFLPEPRGNEVRIRIEGCGVCGSNLPPWQGRDWFNYPFPSGAPGHEGWGEVDAIGEAVTQVKIGDRVAVLSYHAFAECDVADENVVVRLPTALKKKPFPGEALGCAMNVMARSQIKSGELVAVVGIGFLGALVTALAVRAGAQVVAISRRDLALDTALAYGAAAAIPLRDREDIVKRVEKLTDGKLCDCVIESVGSECPLNLAAELTKERGRLIIAGYHQDGQRRVNMQLWNWRGLDVINAHERDPNVYVRGMKSAVDVVASGELDPSPLYTHTFPLQEIQSAFATMNDRPENFLKALIRL